MKLDILLPTNLSEIPLSRYQEFIAMKEKSNDEEFIAQKMIQIFCGMKLGEVAKIKMKHLNELIAHFTKVFSEKPQLIRKFKIKDIEFGFIPKFDDISFGEYVDLENYMKDWKTYHKALSVMYRPIKNTNKDKYEIVDYEPNEDMQDLMKFAPLDVAISSSFFFVKFRNRITESYPDLFEERTEEDDGFNQFSERYQFGKNWGWYGSIYGLADGDIAKFDEVTSYRLTKCLTYLTFKKQKHEIEAREIKQQMKR